MTGYCPLCKQIIMTLTVVPPDCRDTSAIYATLEMLAEVRKHWQEVHTPKKGERGFITDGPKLPPWIDCEAAGTYGEAIAWANAVEIAGGDVSAFVFSLFWMRQELFSVTFDVLANKMARRRADGLFLDRSKSDLEPLVVQGRIEMLERILLAWPPSRDDIEKALHEAHDHYFRLTDTQASPALPESGQG